MISGFSYAALNQLAGALGGGGGAAVVIDLTPVAVAIEKLTATAERIDFAIRNPSWTEGDEMCRRSAHALANGWFDDALHDAQLSIDAYPYRALPHLLAALAWLHDGDAVAAFGCLEAAVKYGVDEHRETVTAALIGAAMADAAGRPERAVALLRDATSHVDDAPALIHAQLARGDNRAQSARAHELFWRNPALSVAVAADTSIFDDITHTARRSGEAGLEWLDARYSAHQSAMRRIRALGDQARAMTGAYVAGYKWTHAWTTLDSLAELAGQRPTPETLRDALESANSAAETVRSVDRIHIAASQLHDGVVEGRKLLSTAAQMVKDEIRRVDGPIAPMAGPIRRARLNMKYAAARDQTVRTQTSFLSSIEVAREGLSCGLLPDEGEWLSRRKQREALMITEPLVELPGVGEHLG